MSRGGAVPAAPAAPGATGFPRNFALLREPSTGLLRLFSTCDGNVGKFAGNSANAAVEKQRKS
jgi:hypothetical protein